jgi:hypothetical protein
MSDALPTVRGFINEELVAYDTYESERVEVFHETVKAVSLTLEVATLVITGGGIAAEVVNASGRPLSVVDVAMLEYPVVFVPRTQK